MKKIGLVLAVLLLTFGGVNAQNYVGRTKAQVKAGVTKQISPKSFADEVSTRPTYGYEKYWWGSGKTDYYTYFDKNGLCFLEHTVIYDEGLAMQAAAVYAESHNCYVNETPRTLSSHKFIQGKVTLEVTITKGISGNNEFHFWFFKPEHKEDVIKFFKEYYK